MSTDAALTYSFRTVGVALATTTIILVSGFSVLTLSAFAPNIALGSMSSIAFVLALVCTYFLIPPLLYWLDDKQAKEESYEEPPAKAA